jgi:hypothetical protein
MPWLAHAAGMPWLAHAAGMPRLARALPVVPRARAAPHQHRWSSLKRLWSTSCTREWAGDMVAHTARRCAAGTTRASAAVTHARRSTRQTRTSTTPLTLTNQCGPPPPAAQHTMPRRIVVGWGGLGCRGVATYEPGASSTPCSRKPGSGLCSAEHQPGTRNARTHVAHAPDEASKRIPKHPAEAAHTRACRCGSCCSCWRRCRARAAPPRAGSRGQTPAPAAPAAAP